MTDLLTKVRAALEKHEASWDQNGKYLAGTETTALEDMAPDMARALIAETERREKAEAENAALREMQGLPPSGTYPKGELKRRMEARRAAMEGRTDDRF